MVGVEGHDGPYAAPIRIGPRVVSKDWIDFNGHMNVAYFVLAFDQAMDGFMQDQLGIGENHAARTRQGPYALQNHLHYLSEMLEGQEFTIDFRLIDHDEKRIHVFIEMRNMAGKLAATSEAIMMNVDLEKRRSTPYMPWVKLRLEAMQKAHSVLERPAQLGLDIGLRRKG